MLDAKGTFDDLVQRYARTPEQAEVILANRLYQNLAGALSGTQEYMAMEKLYELVHSEQFDVVVVDTPPTRNALDLLDAPRRLTRFLENRLFRALLVPTRVGLRAVGVATQALLRTIAKVAGSEIVQDAVSFFQAFEGMEEGFRNRASAVRELLADPSTAYVLVTSARPDAVGEAGYFAEKLAERQVDGLRPRGEPDRAVVRAGAAGAAGTPASRAGSGPARRRRTWRPLEANLAELNALAAREEEAIAELVAQVAPAPVGRIPLFGRRRARARRPAAGGGRAVRPDAGAAGDARPDQARRCQFPRRRSSDSVPSVQTILVASDAPTLRREIEAVISGPDVEVRAVTSGPEVVGVLPPRSRPTS